MKQPFESVVVRHGTTVLCVCRVVLGPHDAEDAWSETFLAAMRAYPGLPGTANAEAWLVTIAHRKAVDVLRAAKRNPLPVDEVPEAPGGQGVPDGAGRAAQAGAVPAAAAHRPQLVGQARPARAVAG
ncbi:RNA polymerase sigma factor, partial [Streptomyces sp. NPDC090493]|uniref:RNA polymerase sigma factor n=1 Tax=Streptomyces sp. NPDC090493 TaxID=3365964 RepID=UPI003828DF54